MNETTVLHPLSTMGMGIFRLERLHDERAELECPIRASRFELGPYRRALRPEIRELLGKVISRTRRSLRRRLVERLTCEAFEERERRGYRFTVLVRRAPARRRLHT